MTVKDLVRHEPERRPGNESVKGDGVYDRVEGGSRKNRKKFRVRSGLVDNQEKILQGTVPTQTPTRRHEVLTDRDMETVTYSYVLPLTDGEDPPTLVSLSLPPIGAPDRGRGHRPTLH